MFAEENTSAHPSARIQDEISLVTYHIGFLFAEQIWRVWGANGYLRANVAVSHWHHTHLIKDHVNHFTSWKIHQSIASGVQKWLCLFMLLWERSFCPAEIRFVKRQRKWKWPHKCLVHFALMFRLHTKIQWRTRMKRMCLVTDGTFLPQ